MQFVRFEQETLHTRGENHRVGTFRFKNLGEGRPGRRDNFYLRWVLSTGDFFSPRHFHNFDQVRLQVRGTYAFGEDGTMHPGTIGYFPESTPYGPQTSADDTVQLVLQIGAPGGAGYIGEHERVAAVAALAKQGRFEGGRYFAESDRTSTGQDGFEAVWEHASGRRVRYAPKRLEKPLLVHPDAYEWLPVSGAEGVRCKRIWDFGGRTVGCLVYRLGAGATLALAGAQTCWVQDGRGRIVQAGEPPGYAPSDALHLRQGETVHLQAQEETTLLVLTHPVFPEETP
jgi:hypothetical protein